MNPKVNEISIRYREKRRLFDSQPIKGSQEAAVTAYRQWDKDAIGVHESFKVMLLNNSNKVKGIYQVSTGGITGTTVDVRLLFAVIIKTLSVGVILLHNHPSGTLKPSLMDKQLTEKICKAAQLLDIKVLDHLIIVPNGDYFSFADNGLL
ncbi:JAB domain-containing protein [Flavobacteriaceae bacterium XHP0103]|uniref:JAB domain-containing protein n=1 Tax=Marixanthotalea marina TaxID=2844359 RepID=UPI002989A265|nr:JAB domain-containing protein [Marixanthotalea marina]MBU3820983.1 JAB domain-containing protein [Marixanthotalea marina]